MGEVDAGVDHGDIDATRLVNSCRCGAFDPGCAGRHGFVGGDGLGGRDRLGVAVRADECDVGVLCNHFADLRRKYCRETLDHVLVLEVALEAKASFEVRRFRRFVDTVLVHDNERIKRSCNGSRQLCERECTGENDNSRRGAGESQHSKTFHWPVCPGGGRPWCRIAYQIISRRCQFIGRDGVTIEYHCG